MRGFLLFVALLCLSTGDEVVQGQEEICRGVICPRGRMCVPHTDEFGIAYTTCECPTSCPAGVNEPVCSYYNTEFNSLCEMHKYGCAHDLTMKVKNQGSCPPDATCDLGTSGRESSTQDSLHITSICTGF